MVLLRLWSNPTTKDAYHLAWVGVFVTVVAILIGLRLYATTGYSLCLVYGMENVVDFLSSVVVLWRFFAPASSSASADEVKVEAKLRGREQRASLAISVILAILGLLILVSTQKKIASRHDSEQQQQLSTTTATEEEDESSALTYQLCFWSFIVFGILTLFKFHYSVIFNSESLYKDGICSLIGTILSALIFINTFLALKDQALWWIDPVISILLGIIAAFIGMKGMYIARQHILSWEWWSGKDKKEVDTMNSDPSTNNAAVSTNDMGNHSDNNDDTNAPSNEGEIV